MVNRRESDKLFPEHAEHLQQNCGPMFLAFVSKDVHVNGQYYAVMIGDSSCKKSTFA
jgi:hypothetical protein